MASILTSVRFTNLDNILVLEGLEGLGLDNSIKIWREKKSWEEKKMRNSKWEMDEIVCKMI